MVGGDRGRAGGYPPAMTVTVRLATEAGDIAPTSARSTRAFFDDPVMNFLLGTQELPFDKGVKFFTLISKIQMPHREGT